MDSTKTTPVNKKKGSLGNKKLTQVEATVSKIRDHIANNELGPGDSLPTEAELVEMTGASRWIVREALRLLDTLGIVRMQRGRRTVIGSNADRMDYFASVLVSVFEFSQTELRQLHELRLLIESFCVPRFVENATEEDIADLEAHCREMEANLDNKEKRNVVDIDFHLRLVEIAGNQFMLQVMQLIRRPILFHMIASLEMEAAVHSHWDIVQAIKDRDEKKAAELIHHHCLRGYKLASYYMIGTGQSFTPSAVRSVREKRG